MDDVAQAAQTIAKFLQTFTLNGGLRLRYRVKLRNVKPSSVDGAEASERAESDASASTQGAGSDGPRNLYVEFSGPDTMVLTGHNG